MGLAYRVPEDKGRRQVSEKAELAARDGLASRPGEKSLFGEVTP